MFYYIYRRTFTLNPFTPHNKDDNLLWHVLKINLNDQSQILDCKQKPCGDCYCIQCDAPKYIYTVWPMVTSWLPYQPGVWRLDNAGLRCLGSPGEWASVRLLWVNFNLLPSVFDATAWRPRDLQTTRETVTVIISGVMNTVTISGLAVYIVFNFFV